MVVYDAFQHGIGKYGGRQYNKGQSNADNEIELSLQPSEHMDSSSIPSPFFFTLFFMIPVFSIIII
jgi:hypothetical protein